MFGTTLSFLFDVWLRVELLSHLVTLFNVFRNRQAVYHFTLTTGVYESYSVSMSSPTFTCLFDGSILRVWICISCFWFAFPQWLIEWNISLRAAILLHSLQKCLFRFYILRLGNFSFCWVWSVIYILQVQVPSQLYDWQILSPFLGIVFSLSWGLNFKGCRRFFLIEILFVKWVLLMPIIIVPKYVFMIGSEGLRLSARIQSCLSRVIKT